MNHKKIIIIPILMLIINGCIVSRTPMPTADYYYLNPDANISSIGKVVLVPLENNSVYPQIVPDVKKALFEEIQKKQRFSLRALEPDDPDWKSVQLDPDSKHRPEKLLLAAKTLNCDAILAGTITEYVPYPHQVLGLRLQLIRLNDSAVLWGFEQVWDTTDKKTEERIKKYIKKKSRSNYRNINEQLISISSIKFTKFIANEVASTF